MKFQNPLRLMTFLGIIFATTTFITSCQPDEVIPVPTISAGTEASGTPGAKILITANINAPGGLKTLTILKNGAAFDSKSYAEGILVDNYSKEYTIEDLSPNTVLNFTIIATDAKSQSSAPANFSVKVTAIPPKEIVLVSGLLTGNISWTKNKIYKLRGFVRVGGDTVSTTSAGVATGVLTIEPGTVIVGERASKGTLIIQRGSQIIANGTASQPIIFTSERAIGQREAGDWGGLVICGKGLNNLPGGSAQLEGSYKGWHGGTIEDDNSGSLKYVRVEYAGVPINPNQEINSFTFGSVGSKTTFEYLQASFGGDDAFEWFGGSANAKYLVAYRCLDDDFDVDNGFSGNVQFAVALRGSTAADQSGSNGFEVDNDGQGTAATPFTSPTFANVSIIGAKQSKETFISTLFQNGMHLRRNNKIKIFNTFITGFPNGIYIDGSTTAKNALDGGLKLENIVIAGVKEWGTNSFGQAASTQPQGFAIRDVNTATPAANLLIGTDKPSTWFAAQKGNKQLADWNETGISPTTFETGRPNFTINSAAVGSISKGAVATTLPAFFTATDYVGAFKDSDWTVTWAEFNPNSIVYIK